MSRDLKYIGMDVHEEAVVIAVRNGNGKLVVESIVETEASSILQFIHGLRGEQPSPGKKGAGQLAVRSLAAAGGTRAGLHSTSQRLTKGRQPKRPGGRTQAG
jgi:hypothetical protein